MNPTVDPISEFVKEREEINRFLEESEEGKIKTRDWLEFAQKSKYSYQFDWMGRPIIQYPQDIVMMQEIIWDLKPDLIIETGIAHGGSLILSASMLALIDMCEAIEKNTQFNPSVSKRRVLGIDIDIRKHNKNKILNHPLSSRIKMLEGSSISREIVEGVRNEIEPNDKVLVCLDSNHTHDHVLEELKAYAPMVSKGSYCIVFDTVVEDLPANIFEDRPWEPGNSPKSAVREFLNGNSEFVIDKSKDSKLLISVAPGGFLRRVK